MALSSLVLAAVDAGSSSAANTRATARSTPSTAATTTVWTQPNGDELNTRDVGGPIDASTVSKLGIAWTDPITVASAFGGYTTTPVVNGGVIYTPIFQGGTKSFTVTLVAGTYTYYCSVPGHRAAGMHGTLTVTG